jgi:putative restriction endonuclease
VRYWWVNQKQTYRHEVPGGYLWSPKRKSNGAANAFYDFMREMAPGDVVFSYADASIRAIGIASSHAYEAPKPLEFGAAGAYWNLIGWRVDVAFIELRLTIRPSEYMQELGSLLPKKYSPLLPNGRGLQSVYLTSISEPLAATLIDLLGAEARDLVRGFRVSEALPTPVAIGQIQWEEHELENLRHDERVSVTMRRAVIEARRGQGLFKERVMRIERACRLTGVDQIEHLRASHCKPWRDSSNEERLDGENGLLLTPSVDHLFDRGFISFEDDGELLISPVAHASSLQRMGVDTTARINVGAFAEGQRRFLSYHRESILLRSKFLAGA